MTSKGRQSRNGAGKPPPLMSVKEIRIRAERSFFALPLGLQDAYLRMMETSLACAKGDDLRFSGACLDE